MANTGQQLAYVRVSTAEQNLARQEYLIEEVDRVFQDKLSGKNADRPGLQDLLAYARSGDHVHVHELARLGRTNLDLQLILKDLLEKGVSVTFRREGLTFEPGKANPIGKAMLDVTAAFAEMERTNGTIRQAEGIAAAKARGVYRGGKPSLTEETAAAVRARVATGVPKAAVAREFNISRNTLYRYLDPTTATRDGLSPTQA